MRYIRSFTPVVVLLCSGCDILFDEAIDCIDNDKPEFSIDTLAPAYLNELYSQEIQVNLVRETNDSWYQYDFVVYGQLPLGIEMITDQFSRKVEFYGVPVEPGQFDFNLSVKVTEPGGYNELDEPYNDGDDLCRNTANHDYVINVMIQD